MKRNSPLFAILFPLCAVLLLVTPQASHAESKIRYDGFYRNTVHTIGRTGSWSYLRFYADHTVISVSTTKEPKDLINTFIKTDASDVGAVTVNGNRLAFWFDGGPFANTRARINYTGTIDGNAITLSFHDQSAKPGSNEVYEFIPMPPRECTERNITTFQYPANCSLDGEILPSPLEALDSYDVVIYGTVEFLPPTDYEWEEEPEDFRRPVDRDLSSYKNLKKRTPEDFDLRLRVSVEKDYKSGSLATKKIIAYLDSGGFGEPYEKHLRHGFHKMLIFAKIGKTLKDETNQAFVEDVPYIDRRLSFFELSPPDVDCLEEKFAGAIPYCRAQLIRQCAGGEPQLDNASRKSVNYASCQKLARVLEKEGEAEGAFKIHHALCQGNDSCATAARLADMIGQSSEALELYKRDCIRAAKAKSVHEKTLSCKTLFERRPALTIAELFSRDLHSCRRGNLVSCIVIEKVAGEIFNPEALALLKEICLAQQDYGSCRHMVAQSESLEEKLKLLTMSCNSSKQLARDEGMACFALADVQSTLGKNLEARENYIYACGSHYLYAACAKLDTDGIKQAAKQAIAICLQPRNRNFTHCCSGNHLLKSSGVPEGDNRLLDRVIEIEGRNVCSPNS